MVFNRDEYDERQVLARGRAFVGGCFRVMICLVVCGMLDMLMERWCDALTGCIICICVALLVFASICIKQDAFAGIGKNRKRNLTVLLVLTLANMFFGVENITGGDVVRDGLLTFRSVSLIVGATTGVVLLIYWLHGLRDRGEEE